MMKKNDKTCAIIGAGIAGIFAAPTDVQVVRIGSA